MQVAAVQLGPATDDLDKRLDHTQQLLSELQPSPDLIVLPELFSRPFWCVGLGDQRYFDWAESLQGITVSRMAETAQALSAHVVVPFFERGAVEGEYFNSAVLVAPDGGTIPGRLPTGEEVQAYRKNAISSYVWDHHVNDEKFYFRPGRGFPVFDTGLGKVGILICYDRWFPEAWRVLALQGAEIVCVPNASEGFVSDMLIPSMRAAAAQNQLFVVVANRAVIERVADMESAYYGLSCVIGSHGEVLAEGGESVSDEVLCADVDLQQIRSDRLRQAMYRDRRPELYGIICQEWA